MKKNMILVAMVLFFMGWNGTDLFCKYQKPRFYIKLTGNGLFSSAGDFGDFIDKKELYLTGLANSPSAGYDISLKKDPFFKGFGGEIGIEVAKHAVGISVGRVVQSFSVSSTYNDGTSGVAQVSDIDYKFTAIPIFVFIHYKLVDKKAAKIFFTIGEGFYFATYREDRLTGTSPSSSSGGLSSYLECKRNHLGVNVGLTVDINISRNLALSIDGAYRIVRFKELEAVLVTDSSGTPVKTEGDLYYSTNSTGDDARFDVGKPVLTNWTVLPAVLNQTGIAVSAGLKVIL